MQILVAYSSKHGATSGIAERIADQLCAAGYDAHALPAANVRDISEYDAFVIGSAAYLGHWQKDATDFVNRNAAVLADRPTWLFSSGPLGNQPTDAKGRDQRVAAEPKEIPAFRGQIHPRDHRVFFGALDPGALGLRDRVIRTLPAGRALLPEGDFRNWQEIDVWVDGIGDELARLPEGAAGA